MTSVPRADYSRLMSYFNNLYRYARNESEFLTAQAASNTMLRSTRSSSLENVGWFRIASHYLYLGGGASQTPPPPSQSANPAAVDIPSDYIQVQKEAQTGVAASDAEIYTKGGSKLPQASYGYATIDPWLQSPIMNFGLLSSSVTGMTFIIQRFGVDYFKARGVDDNTLKSYYREGLAAGAGTTGASAEQALGSDSLLADNKLDVAVKYMLWNLAPSRDKSLTDEIKKPEGINLSSNIQSMIWGLRK